MNRSAALAALGLALLACDASNPVAPAAPEASAVGARGTGSSSLCKSEALADAEGAGTTFFSEASASRNNLVLTATIRLDTTRKDSLSITSTDDKAFIILEYTQPGTATVSTGLGFFEEESGRRTQQCTVQLNSKGAVALRPGDEIGEAQILAQLGELTVTPQGVPIREMPAPLAANFLAEPSGLSVIFTDLSTGEPNLHSWDFDDGVCQKDPDGTRPVDPADCQIVNPPECCIANPVHEYAKAQQYVVALRVGRDTDDADDTTNQFVDVGEELELVADFEFDNGSGSGLKVIFTDTSMGNPETHSWNFGDDPACAPPDCSQSTEQNPIYGYKTPGEYAVTLTVTGAGLTSSKSDLVEVGTEIPPLVAKFSSTNAAGSLIVQFVDESTGNPVRHDWNFGDDEDCTTPCSQSSDQNPIHEYPFSDEYIVTLTVTDADDNTALASKVVTVDTGAVRPVARFSFELVGGLTVQFDDESENEPTSWTWNFGDGTCPGRPECSQQNPTHDFPQNGQFVVTLITENSAGVSDPTSRTVDLRAVEADFSFRQSSCTGVFTDRSSGNITEWAWDFDDGSCDAPSPAAECDDPSPTHRYGPDDSTCPFGDYDVTLTVNGSSSITKTITIAPF